MNKILVIALSVIGLYGSMSPMEQALKKPKVAAHIKVLLADEQEAFLFEDQIETLRGLCSAGLQEVLKIENGVLFLSGLAADGLSVLVKYLEVIEKGDASIALLLNDLFDKDSFEEFKNLVVAADYLGIEGIVKNAFACLEKNIFKLIRCQPLIAVQLLNLPFTGCKFEFDDVIIDQALWYSAKRGYDDLVKLLLIWGANINACEHFYGDRELEMSKNKGADYLPHDPKNLGGSALVSATHFGHISTVSILIENGAELECSDDKFFDTALFAAARNGHLPLVKLLLEKGAMVYQEWALEVDQDLHDWWGSVLKPAVEGGNVEVVTYILEHVTKKIHELQSLSVTSLVIPEDVTGEEFQRARQARRHVTEVCRRYMMILSYLDTALNRAVELGNKEIVKVLLFYGASARDSFYLACEKSHLEIVELLVSHLDKYDRRLVVSNALEKAETAGNAELIVLLKKWQR